jgi:aryl-alcohol dehydrogenase-like predicted oxidoreductase
MSVNRFIIDNHIYDDFLNAFTERVRNLGNNILRLPQVGRLVSALRVGGYFLRFRGVLRAQLSIAWLLHHSPVILPIPGTSSVQHLEENVASASLRLSDSEWEDVERSAGG